MGSKILILILFSFNLLFAFFCPPCVCTETASSAGERVLSRTQKGILLKEIIPNLKDALKEAEKLKKVENEQLNLVKKLTAIEYYKVMKEKQILKELNKQENLLILKIKAINNQAKAQNLESKFFLYKQK
jgi:thiol-disulfide isomerase/thioredoxin